MMGGFPGWPGPAYSGTRARIPQVALPAMPAFPSVPGQPNGQQAGTQSPLQGLAAYGVPVGQTAAGQRVLTAGGMDLTQFMPPEIAGMPRMPTPPDWMSGGTSPGGGLFRPIAGVEPFDPSNRVRQHRQG
jgi:hypothetical protein